MKSLWGKSARRVLETAGSRAEAVDAVRASVREGDGIPTFVTVLALQQDGRLVLWLTGDEHLWFSPRAWEFTRALDEVRTDTPFVDAERYGFRLEGHVTYSSGSRLVYRNRRQQLATTLLRKLPRDEAQLVVRMLMG